MPSPRPAKPTRGHLEAEPHHLERHLEPHHLEAKLEATTEPEAEPQKAPREATEPEGSTKETDLKMEAKAKDAPAGIEIQTEAKRGSNRRF